MRRNVIPLAVVGLLSVFTAGAAVLAVEVGGRVARPGPAAAASLRQPGAASVTTVELPHGYFFNDVVTVNGKLALTGEPISALKDQRTAPCLIAPVNRATLRVGHVSVEPCDDPSVDDEQVAAVLDTIDGGNELAISISHVDPSTGRVAVSAPVLRFEYASDTRPVIAYGGGSMWVYDVATSYGPIAIQVSPATGAIEDTVAMPKLYRPVMAANGDGLWIGNSIEGSPTSDVIYHVAPGATTVTGLVPSLAPGAALRDTLTAQWITASGDHVWAGIGVTVLGESLWRFDGSGAHVVFRAPDRGFEPFAVVVGSLADGLWTQVPQPRYSTSGTTRQSENVLEISPTSGSETVVAKLPPFPTAVYENGPAPGQMAYLDGSLYLLEPPFDANGYLGYSKLVRVTPR